VITGAKYSPPRLDENAVGALCDSLMTQLGWTVERYEQRRASRICEGLPDRRYVHRARQLRIWVELKAPGKKMTREQRAWLLSELDAGGLATVIDDVSQLQHLLGIFTGGRVGQHEQAARYCAELVHLCSLRGYRGERITTTRKRA
jgi:hypothetical protein